MTEYIAQCLHSADEPAALPEIGSRFLVTKHQLNGAAVSAGDEVEVSSHHTNYFGAKHNGTTWYFRPVHIGNGLEPVVESLDGAPAPASVKLDEPVQTATRSIFAAHVTEAKRLLAGTDHTGADVIRLAEILAQQ
ncbi:hypothetical protein AB0K92_15900 [Streptomyces sp. NPDC052687]|uniref:hypothetical protein n=1 Tax=Streptomyces sp. NPDC052687 TaxID=3154759 RepID=UPI00344190C6